MLAGTFPGRVSYLPLNMPFCSQCGNRVGDADAFCGACGTRQPGGRAFPLPGVVDPLSGISPRAFSIMCYIPVIGWVASIIVLGARRFRTDLTLRFHAFQGLYLFGAWLLVEWAVSPIFSAMPHGVPRIDHLLKAVIMVVWVFMLVRTSQGVVFSLPLLGELAHRSAHERGL